METTNTQNVLEPGQTPRPNPYSSGNRGPMGERDNKTIWWWVGGIFALIVVGFLVAKYAINRPITSYEDCVKAGYPILESYPEQCKTPDGKTFTREISADQAPGHIRGKVTLTPICAPDEACTLPVNAYSSREVVVYANDGTTIKERIKLDPNGSYDITIAPGTYWIELREANAGSTEKKQITVMPGTTTTQNYAFDLPLYVKG